MGDVGLTIVGTNKLVAALDKLDSDLRTEKADAALYAGGLVIANAAKRKCPVKTHTLQRSIHVETHSKGGSFHVPEREAWIGTDLVYAAMQEFGGTVVPVSAPMLAWQDTDNHGHKGDEWHFAYSVTIPPHPYMRPAIDETKSEVLLKVAESLKQLLGVT